MGTFDSLKKCFNYTYLPMSSPAPPPPPLPAWPHLAEGQLHLQIPLESVLGHCFSILQHLVGWRLDGLRDLICRQHLEEERLSLGINWADLRLPGG